jgi:hypothetical protein
MLVPFLNPKGESIPSLISSFWIWQAILDAPCFKNALLQSLPPSSHNVLSFCLYLFCPCIFGGRVGNWGLN